ncbi:hypothetical protein FACS1894137_19820 [Spirochaetia bacterium]|nr:hypothetical protein FACS1894137_19820 [Spirochaetia bacterium]
MEKAELIKSIDELQEVLKDYNKFIYVFSDDEGKRTLAKTCELMGKIKWLLAASDTKDVVYPENPHLKQGKVELVRIRPCGEKYGNKTYLGILIGDMACGTSSVIKDSKIKISWTGYNPAIFVPDLNKIIFGFESWWSEIENPDDFKEISNGDIENTWYVKLLNSLEKHGENHRGNDAERV